MASNEQNVGNIDSALRWTAGLALLAAGLTKRRWWGILGLIPLYSAATRYCPINKALGINTTDKEEEEQPSTTAARAKPFQIRVPALASSRRGPRPFESKHPFPQNDHAHKQYENEHHTHMGNGPGERNQIGGRSSGKTPRFQ